MLIGGSDFEEVESPRYVIIAPTVSGNTISCFTIRIYNDLIFEETESFQLVLDMKSSNLRSGVAIIERSNADIFITNNDGMKTFIMCTLCLSCRLVTLL